MEKINIMEKVCKIIIDLLRFYIFNVRIDFSYLNSISKEEWMSVYNFTNRHNIQAIIYDAILELGQLPPNFNKIPWILSNDNIEKKYYYALNVLSEIQELFTSNGIAIMLLKGIGFSSYYPIPNHRTFSDIDIYLYGDHDKGNQLLKDNFNVSVSEYLHHHTNIIYKGIMLENHYDFINIRTHKCNIKLNKILINLSVNEKGEKLPLVNSGGKVFDVTIPSPTMNAIFNMRHLSAHFASEVISMRHLLDWALFLKKEHSEINFTRLCIILEDHYMLSFYNAINGVLIKNFGMNPLYVSNYVENVELENKIFANILNPKLPSKTKSNIFVRIIDEIKIFINNRWKHKLIYPKESIFLMFIKMSMSYILNPKTLLKI